MTLTTTTVNCAGCSASCVNGFVTRARRHLIAPSAAGVDGGVGDGGGWDGTSLHAMTKTMATRRGRPFPPRPRRRRLSRRSSASSARDDKIRVAAPPSRSRASTYADGGRRAAAPSCLDWPATRPARRLTDWPATRMAPCRAPPWEERPMH
jgi:hypothetical protein